MAASHAFGALCWLAETEFVGLLGLVIAVITFQVLTGRINTSGLLADSSGPISPVKAQLLLATLGVAGSCLIDPGHISLVDPTVAGTIAGGSNALYLVRKYLNPQHPGT
jgi:hypothetical protein